MNEFLEKAMVFINENTMLLIGICIFLILVLIGYLIDNAIKTRKLEKQELEKLKEEKPIEPIVQAPIEANQIPIEEPKVEEPVAPIVPEVKEEPVVEQVEEIKEPEVNQTGYVAKEETGYVEATEERTIEPAKTSVTAELVNEEPIVENNVEVQSMEDLLNKDFSKNAEVVNNLTNTQIIKPVVTEVPATPVQEKSPYKNGKSLSDILGKKKEEPRLETTQDFSDELDKILSKLNEGTNNSFNDEEEFNNRF